MPKHTYDSFWNKLAPAYPVSKGAFKLPIATKLQHDEVINVTQLSNELSSILQSLLNKYGTKKIAQANASLFGEGHILPLINEEFTGVARFDCVKDANTKEIKILEINCDYPDGLILHDKTYSILSDEECTLHQNLILSLLPNNFNNIHILHQEGAHFLDGYYAEKELYESKGKTVTIGPDLPPTPVDIYRRCIEATKLTADTINKLKLSTTTFLNTFGFRTLGYKNLLQSVNSSYIPRTMEVLPETSEEIKQNKSKWLLKPTNGCEGHGIHIGHSCTDNQWQLLVEKTTHQNYIAQEYIEIDRCRVSMFVNGNIEEKELYYDFCPHFFVKKGKIIGTGHILMRFSENPIMNVSQGGGIGYLKLA